MVVEANSVESEIGWMIICFIGLKIRVMCVGTRNQKVVVYELRIGTIMDLYLVQSC